MHCWGTNERPQQGQPQQGQPPAAGAAEETDPLSTVGGGWPLRCHSALRTRNARNESLLLHTACTHPPPCTPPPCCPQLGEAGPDFGPQLQPMHVVYPEGPVSSEAAPLSTLEEVGRGPRPGLGLSLGKALEAGRCDQPACLRGWRSMDVADLGGMMWRCNLSCNSPNGSAF